MPGCRNAGQLRRLEPTELKFKSSPTRWLHNFLVWLRYVWDIEWGERQAESSVLSVVAASLGTVFVLIFFMVRRLTFENFVKLTIEYLTATEDVLILFIGVFFWISIVVFLSVIVGLGVYASSSKRSCLSYAWRRALVIPMLVLVSVAIQQILSVV